MFSLRLLRTLLAIAAFSAMASAQRPPGQTLGSRFPPEMILDRFIDVAKVAPKYFTVELENAQVRVLRAKLDGDVRIPLHDDRSGLIVALKDVHLRLTTPDGKFRDIHLQAGETRWIDGDAFTEQNLSSTPCEFLFIEQVRPRAPVSGTPPEYNR